MIPATWRLTQEGHLSPEFEMILGNICDPDFFLSFFFILRKMTKVRKPLFGEDLKIILLFKNFSSYFL
jgi:hypothetical protein